MKLFKFVHFPAIELQYDETQLKFVSATFLWISGLILQIVTTLSSAYSVFNVLIDRLFIYKIKVFSIVILNKHIAIPSSKRQFKDAKQKKTHQEAFPFYKTVIERDNIKTGSPHFHTLVRSTRYFHTRDTQINTNPSVLNKSLNSAS